MAGLMGIEVASAGSSAVFFELELSVALTKARTPLTPAELVTTIRPALGLRCWF